MPLADRIYSRQIRLPAVSYPNGLKPDNKSPFGGCWIVDRFYPYNWWLPGGTQSYYVAWILNVDGVPINYQPALSDETAWYYGAEVSPGTEPRLYGRSLYEYNRTFGWIVTRTRQRVTREGQVLGQPIQVEARNVTAETPKVYRTSRGTNKEKVLVDIPPAGPGYFSSTGPPEVKNTAGILTRTVVSKPGSSFPGTYSYQPTVIEYPIGTTSLQRYYGLQLFIQETSEWLRQGLGSNPYRYFLDLISTVPQL
jgi:hypothetical protein